MARVTISMPCHHRPERTDRAIKSLKAQTMTDFEAIVQGDACPHFEIMVLNNQLEQDSRFILKNWQYNYGGCGYQQTNRAIKIATAPYFVFFANDDVIHPDHLENYLSFIEGTDLDFAYFDFLAGRKRIKAKLRFPRIGHCALIIRTEFLRQMPLHQKKYYHDNDLVENMLRAGGKHAKGKAAPTYQIMNYNKGRVDLQGLD